MPVSPTQRRPHTHVQFSWPFFIFQLFTISGVALLIDWLQPATGFSRALVFAFALYFVYGAAARSFILWRHQRAMKLFRRRNYRDAIPAFEQSERYLAANPWIDRQRWIVLLSASAISYREMALFNIGAAHVHLDHPGPARRAFNHFLDVAPRSPLAPTVRKILSTLGGKK